MSTPHNYGSFSYKVTHPTIKNILAARSKVSNTVQVGMPFVKATSTVAIEEYLGPGNIGFTLGIHALPDIKFEDIFSSPQGDRDDPMMGYTYKRNGTNQPIYATTPGSGEILNFLTPNSKLQNTGKLNRVPPPGITSLTVGRNRSGLTVSIQLEIAVPTLAQLEFLNKVFLIPGCGMVVEWGQQFAPEPEVSSGEIGLTQGIRDKMFPWYKPDELNTLLKRLGKRQVPLQEIIDSYVYKTEGQYMWMFGRVATVNTKGNSDGSFNVSVTLKGPSEDQWAYSVRSTAIAASGPDKSRPCINGSNSVEQYLTSTIAGGYNLMTLLDGVRDGKIPELKDWQRHVVYIKDGNKKEGTEGEESSPNTNQSSFADTDHSYFMSWRFFVNVVLNYKTATMSGGIRGIYDRVGLPESVVEKIGFLRPLGGRTNLHSPGAYPLDDPYENYVGANPYLRSYDPGTMIIVNEFAATDAVNEYSSGPETAKEFVQSLAVNDDTRQFADIGILGGFDFLKSDPTPEGRRGETVDRGLLSTGVWLNHKAVISSLLAGETILQGISNLLNKMNNATRNYWSLTLDPLDAAGEQYDYIVVDQNYKGSSNDAVRDLINNERIYTFNKYLRETPTGVVGSELTDFSVELDLPKLLFSQIATMGITQEGDKESAAKGAIFNPCKRPIISDPNERLRQMFGITTISAKPGYKSIDLTNDDNKPREAGECQSPAVGSSPAGSAGVGGQPSAPTPSDSDSDKTKELADKIKEIDEFIADSDNNCAKCEPCFKESLYPPAPVYPPATVSNVGATGPTMKGSVRQYPNALVPLSALTPISGSGKYVVLDASKEQFTWQGNTSSPYQRYNGKMWLEPEAAAAFQKLVEHAVRTNAPAWSVTSAYRDRHHQAYLKVKYAGGKGVADVGSSPHGMGRAIDINELFAAAGNGSTGYEANARVRATNELYKWFSANGPLFGWYNPKRLADGAGSIDECWHFEYWGYADEYPPERIIRDTAPTQGSRFGAVFVTGLTRDISASQQLAAFKTGIGQNKAVFTAEYTNIAAVKQFLAQNPKTPVFLYSAGAGANNVNALIDDPNIDKQKLFLIEPFFSDTTRAAVEAAIKKGLPASNVYVGPVPERGGGNKVIPGTSLVPPSNNHFQAPTYVGRQKTSIISAPPTALTAPTGGQAASAPVPAPTPPSSTTYNEARCNAVAEELGSFPLRSQENRRSAGVAICNEAFKTCKMKIAERAQLQTQYEASSQFDNATATALRDFPNLNKILRYIEILPDHMVAKIRCSSDGIRANAFGAAPGTLSIKADMTLPGIAGLRVGELFWIDKIPAYYKLFGAFQIMGIEDTIGLDGWQTKVHAVFNFLGAKWKDSMIDLLPTTFVDTYSSRPVDESD